MMEGTRMLDDLTKGALRFANAIEYKICVIVSIYFKSLIILVLAGVSEDLILLLLVIAVGSAVVLSGIGGALYAGYLIAIFLLVISLLYISDTFFDHLNRHGNNLGSTSVIFDYIYCIRSDEENKDYSALTFTSTKAMMNGLLILIGKLVCPELWAVP